MTRGPLLSLLVVGVLGAARATPAPLGDPPLAGTAAGDLAASYRLPPLRETRDPQPAAQVAASEVGTRARALGLTAASATHAWTGADATLRSARERLLVPAPKTMRVFTGTTASQLNAVLADRSTTAVRVTAPQLRIDVPVTIRRSDLWLDLGATELRADTEAPPFLLKLIDASRVTVSGGMFASGRHAVLVDRGRDATLTGM